MAGLVIPTYLELYESILNDLKNKLDVNSLIGKTVIAAIAAVYAGKQKLMYIQIAIANKNIYPDTCDTETLRRFARVRLLRDINPGVSGEYLIYVTGETGSVIPSGTTYSNRSGYLYIVDVEYTFTTTTGSVQVRALTPGNESLLSIDDQLQVTSPITLVDSVGDVFSIVTQPTDEETVDELRENVLDSFRLLPQGGSRADYRTWTEGVSGIREVYPYVKQDYAGTIQLYCEAFDSDSSDGHGTPSALLLAAVEDSIEPEKIPMGVKDIEYIPVTPLPVNVVITNLTDISKISAITASIKNYLYDVRPYIGGADLITEINKDKMYVSSINQCIIDSGASFDNVSVTVNGVSITSMRKFENGDIPYINSVTNV
jgi:uncharacterized phage protein gp47/JayE